MQKVFTKEEVAVFKATKEFRQLRNVYKNIDKDDIIVLMLKQNETLVQLEAIIGYQTKFIKCCDDCGNPKADCLCDKVEGVAILRGKVLGMESTMKISVETESDHYKELQRVSRRLKRKIKKFEQEQTKNNGNKKINYDDGSYKVVKSEDAPTYYDDPGFESVEDTEEIETNSTQGENDE